jgi:hypothetical protein
VVVRALCFGSASAAALLLKLALLPAIFFNRSLVLGGGARKLMPAGRTIYHKVQIIGVIRIQDSFQRGAAG